jgi:hypothetical protein
VLGMLLVAVLAAAFAWWWNFDRGRKTLEFFGPRAAQLIRTAPRVEILVVGGAAAGTMANDSVPFHGRVQPVYRRIDISRAPGLIHARTSLLADSSYRDTVPTPRPGLQSFTAVVRFADGPDEVLLAFTHPDGYLENLARGKLKQLIPKAASGWQQFIERNLSAPTPPARARTGPSE